MRFRLTVIYCLVACISLASLGAGWGYAQESPPDEPPAADAPKVKPVLPVREVKPDTYYVEDKNGQLVPLVNVPFETILEWKRLALETRNIGATLPAYAIQELVITGTADRQRAELSVAVTIRLQRDGWVQVPLLLANAVMLDPAEYTGEGDVFVSSLEGGGYACWLQGSREELHRLTMPVAVPVREVGNEFRLSLPTARATSSELDLRVGQANATATVSGGLLEVRGESDATRFRVNGIGSDFEIAWRVEDAPATISRPLLDVHSESTYRIEGPRQVSGVMNLRVSSLRGSFDRFTVRLPVGMRLVTRSFTQSRFRFDEREASPPEQGALVDVKLDERTEGPVEVQLVTELTPVGNGGESEFEVGGFEIEDAVRRDSAMNFTVLGAYALTFKPGPDVNRAFLADESAAAVVARYETFRRNFSLRMQVAERRTQVSVEPVYVVYVELHRAKLEAKLKYKIRGADVFGLDVGMAGWRVDSVRPDSLVDAAELNREQRDPLHIPLQIDSQQDIGETILEVEAVQDFGDLSRPVTITLPRPDAKTSVPAIVALVPADNVEMTVVEEQLSGLERESSRPDVELPSRQQDPAFFRERGDGQSASLVLSLSPRERSVSVKSTGSVRVRPQSVQVQQDLELWVAYEPLQHLILSVPEEVYAAGDLRILIDRQALPFTVREDSAPATDEVSGDSADSAAGEKRLTVDVDLMEDRINLTLLRILYDLPLPEMVPDESRSVVLPLVAPLDSEGVVVTSTHLDVSAQEGYTVQVTDGEWQLEPTANGDPMRVVTANRAPQSLPLQVTLPRVPANARAIVRRVWVQTLLGDRKRRERAVMTVSTGEPQLRIELPRNAALEDAAIDGQRLVTAAGPDGDVTVPLDRGDERRDRVIELWYTLPVSPSMLSRIGFAAPNVLDSSGTPRVFWQLLAPSKRHLLTLPRGMTGEMSWVREGVLWSRQPRLTQFDLENWAQATHQKPMPDTLNGYLFSSVDEDGLSSCGLAPRWLLLLVVSGLALGLGLAWIYLPATRHPAVLFVTGLLLLGFAVLYPDLAIAATQAAYLGLGLAGVALVLKWMVDVRQAGRTVIRGSSYASPDTNTVHASVSPKPRREPMGTTATATASGLDKPLGEPSA